MKLERGEHLHHGGPSDSYMLKPNRVDQPLISNVKQPLIGLAQVIRLPGLMSIYTV